MGLHLVYEFLSATSESYVQEVLLLNYESSVLEGLIFCSVLCIKLCKRHEQYVGLAIILHLFEKNSTF